MLVMAPARLLGHIRQAEGILLQTEQARHPTATSKALSRVTASAPQADILGTISAAASPSRGDGGGRPEARSHQAPVQPAAARPGVDPGQSLPSSSNSTCRTSRLLAMSSTADANSADEGSSAPPDSWPDKSQSPEVRHSHPSWASISTISSGRGPHTSCGPRMTGTSSSGAMRSVTLGSRSLGILQQRSQMGRP